MNKALRRTFKETIRAWIIVLIIGNIMLISYLPHYLFKNTFLKFSGLFLVVVVLIIYAFVLRYRENKEFLE